MSNVYVCTSCTRVSYGSHSYRFFNPKTPIIKMVLPNLEDLAKKLAEEAKGPESYEVKYGLSLAILQLFQGTLTIIKYFKQE